MSAGVCTLQVEGCHGVVPCGSVFVVAGQSQFHVAVGVYHIDVDLRQLRHHHGLSRAAVAGILVGFQAVVAVEHNELAVAAIVEHHVLAAGVIVEINDAIAVETRIGSIFC